MRPVYAHTWIAVWLTLVTWTPCLYADSIEQVRTALDTLQQWLAESEHGAGWNDYLNNSALLEELDKGMDADETVVASVLKRYAADHEDLLRHRFVAVRDAVEEWLKILAFPKQDELPRLLRHAKESFQPVDAARVEETYKALQAALADLDQFLTAAGNTKAEGWRQYLRWDELQAELDREELPDMKVLVSVQSRLEDKYDGLQIPIFVTVRQALRDYGESLVFSRENYRTQFEKSLDTLATSIEKYADDPSHELANKIALRVGILERSDQLNDLVNAIRHYYVRSNLYLQMSDELVGIGFIEQFDETTPINRRTQGRSVTGKSTTTGKIRSRLVPNSEIGEIRIEFDGTVNSRTRTVSSRGPATIIGSGVTQIEAYKQLNVNDDGVEEIAAVAKCVTDSAIENIVASSGIYGQVRSRARAALPQVETTMSRQTEQKISQRLDKAVTGDIREINRRYQQQYKGPLMRRDEAPPLFHFRTDAAYLYAETAQAGDFQLAAYEPPTKLTGQHDLAVRMHESFLNNYMETVYGATTLTDVDAANLADRLVGQVPERLEITEDSEPWSISFARRRPLTVVFEDGGYTVTLRGKRFTSGKRQLGAMHITARYQLEMTPTGPRRLRQGDLHIEPANFSNRSKKVLSAAQTAEKAVLERRFEGLFPAVDEPQGLTLAGPWEKAGQLVMHELSSQNGWLVTGWRLPDSPPAGSEETTPTETAQRSRIGNLVGLSAR